MSAGRSVAQPVRLKNSLQETEALQAAYQAFDTGRGLSAREVKYALRGLGHTVSKADAEAVLARHARSNGEALTEAEFVSAVQRLEQSRDPAAEQAKLFGLLDTEASGFVAVSDLQQVAEELGVAVTPEELAGMVAEFDTNKDGRIELAEFVQMLTSLEPQDED